MSASPKTPDQNATFPVDGGETGDLIRAMDWSVTPLGPVEIWPQSLRTAVDICLASPEPVSVLWGPARIQLYNDAYIAIALDRHPAILGRPSLENWADARDVLAPIFDRVFAGEGPVVSENHTLPIRKADGSGTEDRCFTYSFSAIRDEGGAVGGAFHRVTETTDRVRAVEAHRASEERFRTLAELSPDAIVINADDHLAYANPSALRLLGATEAGQVVGRTTLDFVAPEHQGRVRERIARALAGGTNQLVEMGLVRLDGSRVEVETASAPVPWGGGTAIQVLARDITERKRAEAALAESEARFRQALEIETVGVIFLDTGGLITDANDAFLEMGGYGREDLEAGGLRWDELTPPEWMPASLRAKVELEVTGRTTPYEKEYYRRDGSRWWALFAAKAIGDGAAVEFVLDITERKRAEQERERLLGEAEQARREAEEAVRARDEFLSIASHELRNPLAVIKVTAQQLGRAQSSGRLDGERAERYARAIQEASDRLALLIDDLLNVSRLQSGQFPIRPERTDLARIVRDAVATQRASDHLHRFRVEAAGDTTMEVDRDRIMQVVANLLDNAVKYSPEGGEVRVLLSRDGEGVTLRVRDGGIGLPPGEAGRIFQPFGRAANASESNIPGMGLGLYICRRIAEAHGGRMWADSGGVGRGTTVSLWLPARARGDDGERATGAGDR